MIECSSTQWANSWQSRGFSTAPACEREQLILLDAEQALSEFMIDGTPDRERFFTSVGAIIAQAARRHGRVIAFGEMVALLWKADRTDAAVHLEHLWMRFNQAAVGREMRIIELKREVNELLRQNEGRVRYALEFEEGHPRQPGRRNLSAKVSSRSSPF
jgi:hypothetical protein